jgi:hypothetical protein
MIIQNNILIDHIRKGLKYLLEFGTEIDLTDYDQVKADFKASPELDATAIFSLSLGGGIAVTEDSGTLTLTAQQTQGILQKVLYMDFKAQKLGEDPILIFTAHLAVVETVTNIEL